MHFRGQQTCNVEIANSTCWNSINQGGRIMQEITKIVVPLDLGEHTRKLVDFALYFSVVYPTEGCIAIWRGNAIERRSCACCVWELVVKLPCLNDFIYKSLLIAETWNFFKKQSHFGFFFLVLSKTNYVAFFFLASIFFITRSCVSG